MTSEALVELVRGAFASNDAVDRVASCNCEDCQQLQAAFGGRAWQGMDATVIDSHFSALPRFDPEAFRNCLPAYMLRGLSRPEAITGMPNDVLEFTTYSLVPEEANDWWRERVDGLSKDQVGAVTEFLKYVHAEYVNYFGPPPDGVAQYWSARQQ